MNVKQLVFLDDDNLLQHNLLIYNNNSTFHQNCQHTHKIINQQPANSPHAAGEYCRDCGRWLRWVSKREFNSKNYQNTEMNGGIK
jgi:hypothetical protein